MWRAGPSVTFSTASEKFRRGPVCGLCGPRGRPPRSRVVAEEAEFAYKDLAAVVDMLTASTSPVERRAEVFLSGPRNRLLPIEIEERIRAVRNGSVTLVRTMVHMDEPDHKPYRAMTQGWFSPGNLSYFIHRP